MSYVQSPRQARKATRPEAAATSAHPGAVTYLVFALSVGFAAALVLGVIA